jgi:hypothetical protein
MASLFKFELTLNENKLCLMHGILFKKCVGAYMKKGKSGLWIRIRIGSGFRDFVDPDPYWESGSGSRGKKTKKFQWKNALFSYFFKKNFTAKKVYFLKKNFDE